MKKLATFTFGCIDRNYLLKLKFDSKDCLRCNSDRFDFGDVETTKLSTYQLHGTSVIYGTVYFKDYKFWIDLVENPLFENYIIYGSSPK